MPLVGLYTLLLPISRVLDDGPPDLRPPGILPVVEFGGRSRILQTFLNLDNYYSSYLTFNQLLFRIGISKGVKP